MPGIIALCRPRCICILLSGLNPVSFLLVLVVFIWDLVWEGGESVLIRVV